LVLQLHDFAQPLIVDCDTSGSGIDAVLHQGQGPITFFSRAMAPHHAKLVAYERINQLGKSCLPLAPVPVATQICRPHGSLQF
jgi:hypothetical protein